MAEYTIKSIFDTGSPVEKSELHYCIDTPEESAHLKVEDYEDDEYLICKSVNMNKNKVGFTINELEAIVLDKNKKQTFAQKIGDRSFSEFLNIKYAAQCVWVRFWDSWMWDWDDDKKLHVYKKTHATLIIPNKDGLWRNQQKKIQNFLQNNAELCSARDEEGFETYKAKRN